MFDSLTLAKWPFHEYISQAIIKKKFNCFQICDTANSSPRLPAALVNGLERFGTVWDGLVSWVTFSVIGAYEMSWCQNTHGGVRHLFAKGEHQNRYINDVINESVHK